MPLLFDRINSDPVAQVGMGQTAYCETRIAADSLSRVNIEARYTSTSTTFTSNSVTFHTGCNVV